MIYGYTRAATSAEANARMKKIREGEDATVCQYDCGSDIAGRSEVLVKAKAGDMLAVYDLADLAPDLPSLVRTVNALLERGVVVYTAATTLLLLPKTQGRDFRIIEALAKAHEHYSKTKRKDGAIAARRAGVRFGRPAILPLVDVRKVIADFMNTNAGNLPSSRELAKRLKCGRTKAAKFLAEVRR